MWIFEEGEERSIQRFLGDIITNCMSGLSYTAATVSLFVAVIGVVILLYLVFAASTQAWPFLKPPAPPPSTAIKACTQLKLYGDQCPSWLKLETVEGTQLCCASLL